MVLIEFKKGDLRATVEEVENRIVGKLYIVGNVHPHDVDVPPKRDVVGPFMWARQRVGLRSRLTRSEVKTEVEEIAELAKSDQRDDEHLSGRESRLHLLVLLAIAHNFADDPAKIALEAVKTFKIGFRRS